MTSIAESRVGTGPRALSTRPPPVAARCAYLGVARYLTPRRALALALLLTALAVWGDAATTAEASCTLFYVVPLSVAVWFSGPGAAYLIASLAVIAGTSIDIFIGPRPSSWHFIAWNNGAEAVMYFAFVRVLWALRVRVQDEAELRSEALTELRHAERLTTIGKMASGVAHEIGTPLNVIAGHAELIASGQLDQAEARHSGQIQLEQTSRITSIVRQLLSFSRRAGTRLVKADVRQLAVETVELLQPLARQRRVKLTLAGKAAFATVNCSELQQVLMNLVTNAMDAMPQGGAIEVATDSANAVSPLAPNAKARPHALLSVRDHGTGIAPDVLPKIFDPFFTTKEVGRGTGLGLSVAYGIVQDHGGWIAVESQVGTGTTFRVFLQVEQLRTA